MNLNEYLQRTYNEKGIDRTLLIERLGWTPTQRLKVHEAVLRSTDELRKTAKKLSHDAIPENSRTTNKQQD